MSAARPRAPTRLVLFDLGGVLVDLRGATDLAGLAALSVPDFWTRWLACPWVRAYERGLCDTGTFAREVVASWGLRAAPDEFLEAFARWPKGLFPGVPETLALLRARVRTAVLSNTNPLHWEQGEADWGLERLVDAHFLSFQTGLAKPDAAAFEDVLARTGCAAGEVLFLDDHLPNVLAARALGLEAEQARGFEEARDALGRGGLLPGVRAPA